MLEQTGVEIRKIFHVLDTGILLQKYRNLQNRYDRKEREVKKMKNKEKYEKEIMNIACSGDSIAVLKKSGRIVSCNETKCCLCLFRGSDCKEKIREWAESESIEKTVISKRDRSFLDCLREEYKYISRDENDILCAYRSEPFKKGAYWYCGRGSYFRLNPHFDVDFQMVKWEDDKPWLIENLKKLEVVEGY